MTLASTVAGLAAFAVIFQTVVYFALPSRIRARWASTTVGFVGAGLVAAAGAIFGLERIGLSRAGVPEALAWGVATVIGVSVVSLVMLRRPEWRAALAHPRLASMSRSEAIAQIFIRIPFFTAFVEEAFFRGVLLAALMALYPPEVALWLGAGLFGVWHIGPGYDQAKASNKSGSEGALHTAVTVVAMTVAGAFLVWLRMETGSIWAPFAVHAGVNMTMALWARYAAKSTSTDDQSVFEYSSESV